MMALGLPCGASPWTMAPGLPCGTTPCCRPGSDPLPDVRVAARRAQRFPERWAPDDHVREPDRLRVVVLDLRLVGRMGRGRARRLAVDHDDVGARGIRVRKLHILDDHEVDAAELQ